MVKTRIHLGLRTIKTALAVTLALTIAGLLGSAMPIFSAIGAISAMSRTLKDALTACLTQLTGCVVGCVIGCLFLVMFPHTPPILIGLGVILVILLGLRLLNLQSHYPVLFLFPFAYMKREAHFFMRHPGLGILRSG